MAINQQNQRQQGTGFTNLQNIMQANQGNRLGQAVGSGIQQTGQQVQQGLQSGQNQFAQDSSKGQLGTQAQKENVENILKDPSQVTDQNVADVAKYRTGQYTGPQDISNIDSLKSQAGQAQQQAQQLGSEGGRQSLLQRYAANPGSQYGSGAQRLDTMLLGTGGGQDLQNARHSVSGLTNQVNGAQQAAQAKAQQYAGQAKGFGQQVTNQIGSAEQGIYNPAQAQAQQANITEQQNQAAEQKAAQAAQTGKLSADALKQLGLNSGDRTYGANIGSFLGYTPQNTQATALNVMGQPDFNKYTGLQRLMGETPATAQQNPYQAGKATYDQAGLQAAIAGQKAQLDPYKAGVESAQDIQNLVKQRDAAFMHAGIGTGRDNLALSPEAAAIQAQINAKYAGAASDGFTRGDWANSNLQTAMRNLADKDATLGGTVQQVDENGNPIT